MKAAATEQSKGVRVAFTTVSLNPNQAHPKHNHSFAETHNASTPYILPKRE